MEKEFTPYDLALALKELGFDEPCFGYYENKTKELKPTHGLIFEWFNGTNDNDGFEWKISAPTFSQAFRWFREKYKIIGKVNDNSILENTYSISISKIFDSHILYANGRNHNLKDKQGFTTYEEAELECLKKLIEIVKQK